MHAFLLVGSDKKKIEIEIKKLSNIKMSEIVEFPLSKIADVRELSQFTKISKSNPVSIVVRDIENSSLDALNSFLKNLEEPQKNIDYILTTGSEHKLIDTILSRCHVIRFTENVLAKENPEITSLMTGNIGSKLKLVDSIKKRDSAVDLMYEIYYFYYRKLFEKNVNYNKAVVRLKEAQRTLNALKANGNIRLQLSRFFITTENI